MEPLYKRFLIGSLFLAFAFPHAASSAPPTIKTVRSRVRSYPTEEELHAFLKPTPVAAIPDDPPPHEGAMIEIPYHIEPSDMLRVEVLEALPGRPIAGERLVRPDGTISLGFYGAVHVSGLTHDQAKVKIVLHLRTYLDDDYLGLYAPADVQLPGVVESERKQAEPRREDEMIPLPALPEDLPSGAESVPEPSDPERRAGPRCLDGNLERSTAPARSVQPEGTGSHRPSRRATPSGEPAPNQSERPSATESEPDRPPTEPRDEELPDAIEWVTIHPVDSDRVFVDVTAYNTSVYYVLGDVSNPGRMPVTGHETVLDALNFAGGLVSTADRKNIRLVRPGRVGKPARTYPIDYDAITAGGDATANYQLFYGDRIIVGRNEVVQTTIELDRLGGLLHSFFEGLRKCDAMVSTMTQLGQLVAGATLIPDAQREAIVKVWVEYWARALTKRDDAPFNEAELREALRRAIELSPEGAGTVPSGAK